jgi:uncharacterized protein (DUF849 family)
LEVYMSDKIIVTAALTGAWPGKRDNPAVPLTPKEAGEIPGLPAVRA